ncbi:MAG: carboxypeptidase M32 [Vicinamibacterales bacterium]
MAPSSLEQLLGILGDIADLAKATALLEWDEQVYMPPGGSTTHGQMVATVRRLAHERFVADEVGTLLERATRDATGMDPDSDTARLLAVTAHDYDKARRVPAAFVAEQAQALSAGQQAWIHARATNDFPSFRPHLEKLIDLKRRYVGFFPPAAHPYDVLLDEFEPGTTTADVQGVFATLRPRQVALIRELGQRPQIDDAFLHIPYDEDGLWAFSREVVTAMGFDWTRGRQDRSAHPFATGIGSDDVRITSRHTSGEPLSLIFGSIHEAGHALYEQGINQAFGRHSLGNATSLGVHESQSRLWENLVGRSLPFWTHFYPALQRRFPSQLSNVTLDRFYRAINRVQPSLIRVEADEATYNLHVMLRVELEISLVEGRLQVKDLPDAWRSAMQDYLGLTPANDTTGVLQDIHWSIGAFGYFATYTLGNLISAQLWNTFGASQPTRDADVANGNFAPLLTWLRESVHQHGRKYLPKEIVQRATGSGLDPEPYLQYLEQKYRAVYGA